MKIRVCYKKTIQVRPYEPATLEVEIADLEVPGGLDEMADAVVQSYDRLQGTVDVLLESQFKAPEEEKDAYSDDLLGAAEIQ